MKMSKITTVGCAFVALIPAVILAGDGTNANWPSFRGPQARGVVEGHSTPTTWNVKTSENIRWKTEIPGLAHSSPIIWGDRLFVTTVVTDDDNPYLRVGLYGESPDHPEKFDHAYRVMCLNKNTGEMLWEKTAYRGIPKVKRHIKGTHANSTPATDGKHVVAMFGSEGLYCYDFYGNLLWKKDLGLLDSGAPDLPEVQWGFASSPIIHQDRVVVQCDANNGSFLATFDLADGKEIWRTPREEAATWGTPTVHVQKGNAQVLVNGYKHIGAYDFATGKELWKMRGGGDVPVPTPIIANDLIYITNAHGRQAPVYAIRTSATGDISLGDGETRNAHIAWARLRIGNYMQTPLVYGENLYCCRDSGIFAVYEAKTGKKVYKKRLSGSVGFTASPVASDGKIYHTSEVGDVFVIKAGNEYELLAQNSMDDITMATPAISEGTLFFRTQHHVVAVGN